MYNTDGSLRSTYDVLMDLGEAWKTMSTAEQLSVGQTLAGVNQYRVFAAVLSQTATAQQAYQQALNSTGSTEQQNAVYMESLQAKVTAFKTEWESLVLEGGVLNKAFKLFVDLGTVILKLANNDFVQLVGAIALVTISLKNYGLVKEKILATNLASVIAENVAMLGSYSAAIKALTADLLANAIAWASTPFGAVTITIASIFAIKTAIDALTTSQAEYRETIDELITSVNDLSGQTKALQSEYEDLSKKTDLTDAEKNRLELLEAQIEANKILIQQEYDKASATQHEADTTGKYTDIEGGQHQNSGLGVKEGALSLDTELASVGQLKEAYETLNETKAESLEEDSQIEAQKAKIITALTDEGLSLLDLKDKNVELSEYDKNRLETIQSIVGALGEETDTTDGVISSQEEMAEKYGYTSDQISEFLQNNEDLQDQLNEGVIDWEDIAQAMMSAGEQTEEVTDALSSLPNNLKSLTDEYNSLTDAIDDFNNGGITSLDSLEAITNAVLNHGDAISFENGQIVLSEGYYEQLANAQIDEAEAALMVKAQTDLAAISQGEYSTILEQTRIASDNASKAMVRAGQSAVTAGENASIGSEGFKEFWAACVGETYFTTSKQNKYKAIVREQTEAQYEALESLRGQFGNYAKASSSAAKSSSSSASSTKDAWLEAYKAEKDALDSLYETNVVTAEEYATKLQELSSKYLTDSATHQKKYASEIQDVYEKMYDALKKSAKEALDEEAERLKKQLDATKEEKSLRTNEMKRAHDEEEKALKKQIDNQKRLNKEVLDGIKKQQEALKRERTQSKQEYDDKINALKAERTEYERQVKLMELKEQLAKAKATKQYVMDETGKFTYQEDSTAVDEAKESLIEEELNQQYEREVEALTNARDEADRIYEERLQALSDYYDRTKEQQDLAIQQLEDHLDAVEEAHEREEQALSDHYDNIINQQEKSYNDFKDYAERLLNGQAQLTNEENTEWGRRLTNLANFVNEYNRLMNEMNKGSTGNSSNYRGSSSSTKKKVGVASRVNSKMGWKKRASGDASIESDGAYIVGEDPNKEIILGSKLNNGTFMNLSKGDGVVNAKSTKTLAGLINMLGGMKNYQPNTNNNTTTNNSIHIQEISLPNIHNGEEFVDYLQHFDVDMMQLSYDTM